MDTKHGGSEASGLVQPAGLESATPATPGGVILEPEIAKDNRNAKDRALQFERRRLAMGKIEHMGLCVEMESLDTQVAKDVSIALRYADELLKQTGGHV